MDNSNKPTDSTKPATSQSTNSTTSATPPVISSTTPTTPLPAGKPDISAPLDQKLEIPDMTEKKEEASMPLTPTASTTTDTSPLGSLADLGSSMESKAPEGPAIPSTDTPKPETIASANSTTSPEPESSTPTTAGSSVPPASDSTDTTSEAHAGISPPPTTPPMGTAESSVSDPGPGYAKTKSNHMMLIIVGLIVVAFVSVLVMFFYRQYSSLINPSASISPTPQVQAVTSPAPSPTITPANAEERELQAISFEDIDAEFENIEKDLSQL